MLFLTTTFGAVTPIFSHTNPIFVSGNITPLLRTMSHAGASVVGHPTIDEWKDTGLIGLIASVSCTRFYAACWRAVAPLSFHTNSIFVSGHVASEQGLFVSIVGASIVGHPTINEGKDTMLMGYIASSSHTLLVLYFRVPVPSVLDTYKVLQCIMIYASKH